MTSFFKGLFIVTYHYALTAGMFLGLDHFFGLRPAAVYLFGTMSVALMFAVNLSAAGPGRWQEGIRLAILPARFMLPVFIGLVAMVPLAVSLYLRGRVTPAILVAATQIVLSALMLSKPTKAPK